MKKLFTLLLALGFLTLGARADAPAGTQYKSLGMGYMTDDMITGLLDKQPVTYQVEILQAADESPYYKVMAPYGKTFAQAMEDVNNLLLTDDQYDSEGKCFIDIDATDPDDVVFHKTMTGFDIGSGEIFIGINSLYNVTLKDGVFTAPIMGIAVGSGNSAIAGNRRGKFRIVLPGVELNDFDITITPKSQCLTEKRFEATMTVGLDVAEVKYTVASNWQEDEILSAVSQVADKGSLFKPRGEFSYELDEGAYKETIIAVALDAEGNTVGYDWCTYYYIDDNNDGWTDCGDAEFTDGFLQDLISNIPSQTTTCKLQRSKDNPGRLRLVNPYAGLKEFASLGHKDHNHYIYINANDEECIYIEESPICMESSQYGLMRVSSSVYYFLTAGYELEECKELEMGAIVEDGVMTFPEEALMFSMLKYDGGDWYNTDSEGVTTIKLPEGFSLSASIADVVVDTTAEPEYFNLQGIRIAKPQTGTIYIKRDSGKTTKHIAK